MGITKGSGHLDEGLYHYCDSDALSRCCLYHHRVVAQPSVALCNITSIQHLLQHTLYILVTLTRLASSYWLVHQVSFLDGIRFLYSVPPGTMVCLAVLVPPSASNKSVQ